MRIAVCDLGSFSGLLLIVEKQQGRLRAICEERHIVDLRYRARTHLIARPGLVRAGRVLERFDELAREHHCDQTAVVATAALRDADNREAAVAFLRQHSPTSVRILSHRTEAQLSALGALTGLRRSPRNQLVIDIGGGSTEIIAVPSLRFRGLPIGAARATQSWASQLPAQVDQRDAYLTAQAVRAVSRLRMTLTAPPPRVVAVGGTMTSLAALNANLGRFDPDLLHGVTLTRRRIHELGRELACLTPTQLRQRLRFDPDRARVLVAGTYLWLGVLNRLGIERVTVSVRGLRWGLAAQLAGMARNPKFGLRQKP